MQFVKPRYGNLPPQRIARSTFDPHAVEHQGDKEMIILSHISESSCHIHACNTFGVMVQAQKVTWRCLTVESRAIFT